MNLSVGEARATMDRTRAEPGWFVSEVLDGDPWSAQVEVMNSVRDNRITCVPSCHSMGKDWTAARIALWFSLAFWPSKVITTAPTDRQVRLILWSEINAAHEQALLPIGGRMLQQEFRIAPDHFMVGFASPDYDHSKFQGFHSPNAILIILDEADGISNEVRDGVGGLMASGRIVRLLQIGNPINPQSRFAKDCARPDVNTIRVSAFDTPNFTEFGLERGDFDDGTWQDKIIGPLPCPHLVSPEWVAEKLEECGGDWTDPYVVSRVLAIFPEDSAHSLIKQFDLQAALDLELDDAGLPVEISCDVARSELGDDTTIGIRRGWKYRKLDSGKGWSVTETAGRLIDACERNEATRIKVDDDGVGGGVVDILREQHYPVTALRGGSSANQDKRFINARTEWHWNLRTLLSDGKIDIDPRDENLIQQLGQLRTNGFDSLGRMKMERKEDYKKRVGRSPDDGDCCIYAYAEPRTGKSKGGPRIRT